MNKFTTGLFMAVALCTALTANAARPSFTSLQQQINVLSARVNELEGQPKPDLAYDGNGTLIGTHISIENDYTLFHIRNESGYLLQLATITGRIRDTSLFYESADCSTQPYSPRTTAGAVTLVIGYLYYVPLNAELATNLNFVASGLTGDYCTEIEIRPNSTGWPAFPNDPNITGVFSAHYPAPVTILPQ